MLKKLLLTALLVTPVFSASKLSSDKIYAPARLDTVDVQHSPCGFMVNNQPVQSQHMDKELRSITPSKLAVALRSGYIQVDQSLNGQYKLQYQPRLNGGGALGASIGFWFGKILTHAVVQGIIVLSAGGATLVGGPQTGAWVWGTMEKTLWVPTEIASNKIGLGLGIAFGAGTGPV